MKLQGYSKMYLLVFLLCLFTMASAQQANGTDVITTNDVKNDIQEVVVCMESTNVIGPLTKQVINLSNAVFDIMPPNVREQYQQIMNNILASLANILQRILKLSQTFSSVLMPLLELRLLTR